MKKIISIMLILLVGLTIFSGCSSTTESVPTENQQTSSNTEVEKQSSSIVEEENIIVEKEELKFDVYQIFYEGTEGNLKLDKTLFPEEIGDFYRSGSYIKYENLDEDKKIVKADISYENSLGKFSSITLKEFKSFEEAEKMIKIITYNDLYKISFNDKTIYGSGGTIYWFAGDSTLISFNRIKPLIDTGDLNLFLEKFITIFQINDDLGNKYVSYKEEITLDDYLLIYG